MSDKFKVAVLVGSLRRRSFCRKVAKAMMALQPPSLESEVVELGGLSFYDQDLDRHPPRSWVSFRAKLKACDAVLMVTPEYNRSFPGVLKNAMDIASRPGDQSVLDGLAAGVVSVSPYGQGAFGANHALRQTLVYLNMPVMQQPEAYVASAADLFEGGELVNQQSVKIFGDFMKAFAGWIPRANPKAATRSFEAFWKEDARRLRRGTSREMPRRWASCWCRRTQRRSSRLRVM